MRHETRGMVIDRPNLLFDGWTTDRQPGGTHSEADERLQGVIEEELKAQLSTGGLVLDDYGIGFMVCAIFVAVVFEFD